MIYILFCLVLLEILFNWLYKSTEKTAQTKDMLSKVISCIIIAVSVVSIFTSATSVFFYIYFSFLIASNALRTVWLWKRKREVTLLTLYVDTLFTLVACCFVWTKFTYILLAIAFLMVLIMVHEFGHYIAGKLLKFKINEFSIGFGPSIFERTKKNGEKFALRIIPLGGYCAFEGEDEDTEVDGAFNKQKPWKRLIVLFCGVFFNFVFGVIMSVSYLMVAAKPLPQIIAVCDNNSNNLRAGDIILAINDNEIETYKVSTAPLAQVSKELAKYGEGEEIIITILRDNQEMDVVVKKEAREAFRYVLTPEALVGKSYIEVGGNFVPLETKEIIYNYLTNVENELTSVYYLAESGEYIAYEEADITALANISTSTAGVSLGILQNYEYEEYKFGEAVLTAVPFSLDICWLILKTLGGLFTGATAVAELGGTITAVDQIAELTSIDIRYLLYLIPMISMNLAVFNLLPIPALDGARMTFVLIEWIRRKPINRNVEAYIHFIGLLVLFSLVLLLDFYHFFIL